MERLVITRDDRKDKKMFTMINVCKCNICGKALLINDRHTDKVIIAKRSMNELRYVHHRCNVTSATNKETNKARKTATTKANVLMTVSFDVKKTLVSSAYFVTNDLLKHDNHFKSFKLDNIQAISKIIYHATQRFGNENIYNVNISSEHLTGTVKTTTNTHITECLQAMRKYETIIAKHNGIESKTALNAKMKFLALCNE